jgi:phosphoglycolate phosphatase
VQLVLFDIDGTLVWPNGAGSLAMERALTEVLGTAGRLARIYMAGMTDRAIILQALEHDGFDEGAMAARWEPLAKALARHLRATVVECGLRPCPGVPALLDTLRAREDIVLGLVTGNMEITAPIKLEAAGIDPSIFSVGAYGSDHADRNRLPAIAARRAELVTGRRYSGGDIVVVGDTPADIVCGKTVGARTVAVATGSLSSTTLEEAAPDCLLTDFTNLEEALQAILPP